MFLRHENLRFKLYFLMGCLHVPSKYWILVTPETWCLEDDPFLIGCKLAEHIRKWRLGWLVAFFWGGRLLGGSSNDCRLIALVRFLVLQKLLCFGPFPFYGKNESRLPTTYWELIFRPSRICARKNIASSQCQGYWMWYHSPREDSCLLLVAKSR